MSLNVQIVREGEPLPVNWGGGFVIMSMLTAMSLETGKGLEEDNSPVAILGEEGAADLAAGRNLTIVIPAEGRRFCHLGLIAPWCPLYSGSYALQKNWKFKDEGDGEILELLQGDVLVAYRD